MEARLNEVWEELNEKYEKHKRKIREEGLAVEICVDAYRIDELIGINTNEIPTFNGNIYDSMLFLENLERQFTKGTRKLRITEKAMKGDAETWFQWVRRECENFDDFRKLFIHSYWDTMQQEKVKRQLQRQKYDPMRDNRRDRRSTHHGDEGNHTQQNMERKWYDGKYGGIAPEGKKKIKISLVPLQKKTKCKVRKCKEYEIGDKVITKIADSAKENYGETVTTIYEDTYTITKKLEELERTLSHHNDVQMLVER
ncbi:hypothetical protein FQR65_LT00628 [Abscondita terminalis]|nr:hypothetical protein FQR65_LT00628 [Abscondita terminalis]